MTKGAWVYVLFIISAGLIITGIVSFGFTIAATNWINFLVLTSLATIAQLFKSEAPTHQLYHPAFVFLFAGVVLLDPFPFAMMVAVCHLVEWIKERLVKSAHLRSWYLQPFNISMHIIVGSAAHQIYTQISPPLSHLENPRILIAAGLAALVYVVLNHLIVGQALVLARGVSWAKSGILNLENLSTDLVMSIMGFVTALLMELNTWLILPALTPLYLIYRALAVPGLQLQVNTDVKTGLWNAEFFLSTLEAELGRAIRNNRPLTVVMGDLDLLRNINNAFGHLAGDVVLKGVAQALLVNLREYDTIARFGGEEFAILMPEILPLEAYNRIEAVRKAIENSEFEAPTTRKRIKATMSFGIASLNGELLTPKEIIHRADVAVYAAKIKGRNCTRLYSPEVAFSLGIISPELALPLS
jgi:diguanylate cyclase (GGDEF)-like protein